MSQTPHQQNELYVEPAKDSESSTSDSYRVFKLKGKWAVKKNGKIIARDLKTKKACQEVVVAKQE